MQLYWPCSPADAGLAVADVGAGEVLELEGDVLGDVAGPRALRSRVMKPPRRPSEQAWSSRVGSSATRASVKPGSLLRGELLEDAEVDEHPDDRLARPVVRAAQDAGLEDPQRRLRRGRAAVAAGGGAVRPSRAVGFGRGRLGRLGHARLLAVAVSAGRVSVPAPRPGRAAT